ncbi:KH domain-containing protein [Rhodococcus fascians]|uniref:Jag family protein n=1 Tax=Rhodococcoides fascians TaxID=1828 RepID=UPI00195FE599|nr:R3H domain-containing nucleic acid-binding protein [Rhodococcus fascians]MBM7245732.1 KH domain-containing protein [Rhodococcus fascians]MBY3811831.1 KH domain-containing protein [Rhodococcus fascians]MBY3843330.1 KH domain-containing protein [Rhodococcus fascians]MBY3847641.1 KH domain-containing protein [Rhodococcus fascians]MBY3852956.1 KH domain-containing protein [Rhodococcus fascians]
MAAHAEEAQNDEVRNAAAGDGVGDVMVETDQVSAVETESDDEATVDDAVQKTPSVPTSADDVADSNDDDSDEDDEDDEDYLVEEGEIAGDYLEQLLDVLDFDGDIDLDVEGDRAIVSIDGGDDLAKLVGRKGEVLDALQELTRLAVQQSTGERSKLMLDVAGWRAKRRTELGNLGAEAARRVLESGEREELTPMTPFERKIVHDAVAKIDGVASESTGVEPARRVVVVKA